MDPTALAFMALNACAQIPIVGPFILPTVIGGLALMGVCAAVATKLPAPSSATGAYAKVYRVINKIGQNYGNAKNLIDPAIEREEAAKKPA